MICTRVVKPEQLNRDRVADILPRLVMLESVIFTVGSAQASIHTDGHFFMGLADVVRVIHEDFMHLIAEDVAYDKQQGLD